MVQWFESLNYLQQLFSLLAIPATAILLVQTVLMLIGIVGDSDVDLDGPDSDGLDVMDAQGGLALFSVRGIMAFICIGGWSGILFAGMDMHPAVAILLAMACGTAALVGMAYLIKGMLSLQSSGNMDAANAVGKMGEVYIPIPPANSGSGKIMVTVQGRFTEMSAVTSGEQQLKTGETVRVISCDERGVLVVEKV